MSPILSSGQTFSCPCHQSIIPSTKNCPLNTAGRPSLTKGKDVHGGPSRLVSIPQGCRRTARCTVPIRWRWAEGPDVESTVRDSSLRDDAITASKMGDDVVLRSSSAQGYPQRMHNPSGEKTITELHGTERLGCETGSAGIYSLLLGPSPSPGLCSQMVIHNRCPIRFVDGNGANPSPGRPR